MCIRDSRRIIHDNDNVMPKQITVDLDGAFAKVEGEITRNGGVLTRKNMHAVNTLAIVDRVIAKLKVILSSYEGLGSRWAANMERATKTYNGRQHTYLMGTAPKHVKDTPVLQYELEKTHGAHIRHNNEKWKQKVDKLEEKKAFRTPKDRDEWEHVDVPKWKGEVYDVGE